MRSRLYPLFLTAFLWTHALAVAQTEPPRFSGDVQISGDHEAPLGARLIWDETHFKFIDPVTSEAMGLRKLKERYEIRITPGPAIGGEEQIEYYDPTTQEWKEVREAPSIRDSRYRSVPGNFRGEIEDLLQQKGMRGVFRLTHRPPRPPSYLVLVESPSDKFSAPATINDRDVQGVDISGPISVGALTRGAQGINGQYLTQFVSPRETLNRLISLMMRLGGMIPEGWIRVDTGLNPGPLNAEGLIVHLKGMDSRANMIERTRRGGR